MTIRAAQEQHQLVLPPNNWLVFMQNGQEVVIDSGKSVSLTLTMAPAFKDEGELTDMTDITGNLTVLVEAK